MLQQDSSIQYDFWIIMIQKTWNYFVLNNILKLFQVTIICHRSSLLIYSESSILLFILFPFKIFHIYLVSFVESIKKYIRDLLFALFLNLAH